MHDADHNRIDAFAIWPCLNSIEDYHPNRWQELAQEGVGSKLPP
jgi:hypothetical protein